MQDTLMDAAVASEEGMDFEEFEVGYHGPCDISPLSPLWRGETVVMPALLHPPL